MRLPRTLTSYLAWAYMRHFFILLLLLLAVVYLFDTVELLRRANKRDDVPLSLVLQMGLLKLPEVGLIIMPFVILFSAMFSFWSLSRRYELIVIRAAGFSVWQFLAPVLIVAACIGLLMMMVVNPIGALLISKFEQLETIHLERGQSQIAVFEEGLWLRQNIENDDGYVIIHAPEINQNSWELHRAIALFFRPDDSFDKRIDAKKARLEPGQWIFEDIRLFTRQSGLQSQNRFTLPTTLSIADIEDSFASPQSMSFWNLPGHIETLEKTGFDASRLRVHYYNLMAQPLLFLAMVLIAAAVALRPPREQSTLLYLALGIFTGFTVFFLSSFLQALGATQQLPALLAAWSPALITTLCGISIMMALEDG